MDERLKYRLVTSDKKEQFQHELNALADDGYSVRFGTVIDGMYFAVMGSKAESNVEAVKKVSHADVENHIGKNGWEVYGIYANHTLLVRRCE